MMKLRRKQQQHRGRRDDEVEFASEREGGADEVDCGVELQSRRWRAVAMNDEEHRQGRTEEVEKRRAC